MSFVTLKVSFIHATRAEFGNWVPGTPISDDLKAVSWCDGDLSQIENIVTPRKLA